MLKCCQTVSVNCSSATALTQLLQVIWLVHHNYLPTFAGLAHGQWWELFYSFLASQQRLKWPCYFWVQNYWKYMGLKRDIYPILELTLVSGHITCYISSKPKIAFWNSVGEWLTVDQQTQTWLVTPELEPGLVGKFEQRLWLLIKCWTSSSCNHVGFLSPETTE